MRSEAPITYKLTYVALRKSSFASQSNHCHELQKWRWRRRPSQREVAGRGCPNWLRIWYQVSHLASFEFDIVPYSLSHMRHIECIVDNMLSSRITTELQFPHWTENLPLHCSHPSPSPSGWTGRRSSMPNWKKYESYFRKNVPTVMRCYPYWGRTLPPILKTKGRPRGLKHLRQVRTAV